MNSKAYKDYKIDDYVYNELKWFCFQYEQKKQKLRDCYCLKSINYDGVRCENHNGNISENKAINAAQLSKDIDMIDAALHLASDSATYEFLKKNITQKNMPYEKLGNVPMGRRQFYEMRAKFFHILKIMKIG